LRQVTDETDLRELYSLGVLELTENKQLSRIQELNDSYILAFTAIAEQDEDAMKEEDQKAYDEFLSEEIDFF